MTRWKLLSTLLLAAAPGCFHSSPPVTYYTLQPLRQEPAAPTRIALEVLPVRVPDLLLRPQMVLTRPSGAQELSETHRWGNPLDQDMRRVLVDDLGLLLGSDDVVESPLGARVAAAYRLEVEVRSLDARPGTGLTLEAVWMVTRPGAAQAVLVRRATLREALPDSGPEALAAACSRILADLAREISAQLVKLP
jgi:uncharacterized lipoprotein YmbA